MWNPMRGEFVDYSGGLPVSIELANIKSYPIHWNNCIEILYVLEDSLEVTINSGKYQLEKGEIEIINANEAHSIKSISKRNRVLIFHIDQYFFEKYYSDIEGMYFWTNTDIEGIQQSEEYETLRDYLSRILCEYVQKTENYDERIEQLLTDMLYFLLNNFNYLIYEREDLRSEEADLGRYHRITKYIASNYKENVTLKDIAEEEFLSPQYLSHEIKYGTGYAFTDLLNLFRVNESVKLLLDSDRTISDIALEVGFSHLRYYNKYFKQHFSMTPAQYRKKYQSNEEAYEKQKKVEYLDKGEAFDYLLYYLEDYEHYNYEDRIYKIDIDMSSSLGELDKGFKEILNIGDTFEVLLEDNQDTLREIQEEISFTYARLNSFFGPDMGVFPGAEFFNWNRTRDVLEYIDSIGLVPIIMVDNKSLSGEDYERVIESFFQYFSELDTLQLTGFEFQLSDGIASEEAERVEEVLRQHEAIILEKRFNRKTSFNYLYDTTFMLPYIIHNAINNRNRVQSIEGFDIINKQALLTNEVFFGYPGLVNDKGIRKPSYYAYYLMSKLGDTLVYKDNGCIVTKGEGSYQILLYSYSDNLEDVKIPEERRSSKGIKSPGTRKISLNITGIASDVRIITYEINEESGPHTTTGLPWEDPRGCQGRRSLYYIMRPSQG
jgi:AraC-like DNA-binding protein